MSKAQAETSNRDELIAYLLAVLIIAALAVGGVLFGLAGVAIVGVFLAVATLLLLVVISTG